MDLGTYDRDEFNAINPGYKGGTMEKNELAASGKIKWRVGVRSEMVELKTIYAVTQEEAAEAIKQGFGRPAGVLGPVPLEIMVTPADGSEVEAKTEDLTAEQLAKLEAPLIVKPKVTLT